MSRSKKWGCIIICFIILGAGVLVLPKLLSLTQEVDGPENNPADAALSESVDLMLGVTPNKREFVSVLNGVDEAYSRAYEAFTVNFLKNAYKNDSNACISPISALTVLSMLTNGTGGNTKEELESALTGGMDISEWNRFIAGNLSAFNANSQLKLFHSVWLKDGFSANVKKEFLQVNADYYDADVYRGAFDEQTLADVNQWVSDNTDGFIPSMLDKIEDVEVMLLLSALSFEAGWETPYEEHNVWEEPFYKEDGTMETVEMMHSQEVMDYFSSENAVGFVKPYYSGRYQFVAILPNEDISLSEYIQSMSADTLWELLEKKESFQVDSSLPKFQDEYTLDMVEILKDMGVHDVFDYRISDFSGLTEDGEALYVTKALQKTFISVDESGTRAGAASAVAVGYGGVPTEVRTVDLNRPFLYMIVDSMTYLPVFIGTVHSCR